MLRTIFGQPAETYLDEHFPDLNIVRSEQFLQINPKVQLEDYNIQGLSESDKLLLTKQLLEREGQDRVLIFCHEFEQADVLAKYLSQEGVPSESFHSKLSPNERADKLYSFDKGASVCLVCTDLAARGIDFKQVKLVLQFDYADNGINLLHRIGRTGRMGSGGKGRLGILSVVISLVDDAHADLYTEFNDAIKQNIPLDSIFSRNRSFNKKLKKRAETTVNELENK